MDPDTVTPDTVTPDAVTPDEVPPDAVLRDLLPGEDWEITSEDLGFWGIVHRPTAREWTLDNIDGFHLLSYDASGCDLTEGSFESLKSVVSFLQEEAAKGPLVDEGPFAEELRVLRRDLRQANESLAQMRVAFQGLVDTMRAQHQATLASAPRYGARLVYSAQRIQADTINEMLDLCEEAAKVGGVALK